MLSWSGIKRKAVQPKILLPDWFSVQESERVAIQRKVDRAQSLSEDPVEFFRQVVGFNPTSYQVKLIRDFQDLKNQFIALRWCRQSGKSWIVSAMLLWYALTHVDCYIGVVGPSWRQAKLIIRRINYFLKRLPSGMYLRPQRTILRFTNGAVIEAFPNNPETIRGPTLQIIYVDEFNFVADDEELYDSILFTISTTNGKFLCSSTPWRTDSVFYKIFTHKDYEDFVKSHVAWQEALEPNGPLRKNILEKIRKQFAEDPWRWKREMEAEWSEDETVWLSQDLITKCIGTQKTCGTELELFDSDRNFQGRYFCGLDFGKRDDYSVLAIVEEVSNRYFLRFLKIWPLETPYATVIGFVKTLQDKWDSFVKIRADQTGIGDYIVEDMKNSNINNVEGVTFTLPRKQEMATMLKQRMLDSKFYYPYATWERPYPGQYVAELNVERFELRKDETVAFNHRKGSHDDVFWASALAVYATVEMKALDLEALKFG